MKAPNLDGLPHYINTTQENLQNMVRGHVVLYDVWAYSCVNCLRTLPHIRSWYEKYKGYGLVVVGIHAPEFEFEKNPENLERFVKGNDIAYPVVMDNEMRVWRDLNNMYWPAKYLADTRGQIRYSHFGEGGYGETEAAIRDLLAEAGTLPPKTACPPSFQHECATPEMYLGYARAHGRNQLANGEGFLPDRPVYYAQTEPKLHHFDVAGSWYNAPDHMRLVFGTGRIRAAFAAKQVNIVASGRGRIRVSFGEMGQKEVPANGHDVQNGILAVDQPRLYNLVDMDGAHTGVVSLETDSEGISVYTFTFG